MRARPALAHPVERFGKPTGIAQRLGKAKRVLSALGFFAFERDEVVEIATGPRDRLPDLPPLIGHRIIPSAGCALRRLLGMALSRAAGQILLPGGKHVGGQMRDHLIGDARQIAMLKLAQPVHDPVGQVAGRLG